MPAPTFQPVPPGSVAFPAPVPAPGFPPFGAPPKKKSAWGKIVAIILLSLGLTATLVLFAVAYLRLEEANARIDELDRKIEEQKDLIDKKETFGAGMNDLLDTARAFEGVKMTDIVPVRTYGDIASSAWTHRWDAVAVDADIADVAAEKKKLEDLLAAASIQASSNVSGTADESTIDQLGLGFVTTVIEEADALCQSDVWACVLHEDPYTVHFDADEAQVEYMTDWLRTGVAYHEFAHVLQMTNPGPTEAAAASFGGDWETMADCFALTYLPGWSLDHTIWVSDVQYWNVSVGYGYTCDAPQMQVIRDWYEPLGFAVTPISQ